MSSTLTDTLSDFSLRDTELFSLKLISNERNVFGAVIGGLYSVANDHLITVTSILPIKFGTRAPHRAFAYFFEYVITDDGYSSEIKHHTYNCCKQQCVCNREI